MAHKPGTKNFSGPIPETLKDEIDKQLERTQIPIGVVVFRLAQWWASLLEDEQKMFCYGVDSTTLADFVDRRIERALDLALQPASAAARGREVKRHKEDRRDQSKAL